MDVEQAIDNVERICGSLQASFAPELRGLALRVETLHARLGAAAQGSVSERVQEGFDALQEELRAVEGRLRESVEAAKRQIVLIAHILEAERRGAVLRCENEALKQKAVR